MRTRTRLWAASAALLWCFAAGAPAGAEAPIANPQPGNAERVLVIEATEYDLDPETISVPPGSVVTVVLENDGDERHGLRFDFRQRRVGLGRSVPPGGRAEVTFVAPMEEGTYTYYDPLLDHRSRGMRGTLEVGTP